MEYKTKTIIWEDNNEPPKNYIWAKKDGKFYEYSYVTKSWVESKLIKAEESGSSGGGGKTPFGDITIDDVVKFMHDNIDNNYPVFRYTTYENIPSIKDIVPPFNDYTKGTVQEIYEYFNSFGETLVNNFNMFSAGQYNIVFVTLNNVT